MRKIWTRFLCLWLLLLLPLQVAALTPLEPEKPCSLTLHYTYNDIRFQDLQVKLYRVAEASPDGTFDLITPYSSYPVNIHGITAQQEWKDAATTLASYIAANQVKPDYILKTNEKGDAVFKGLKTGLYLVGDIRAEHESGYYSFERFMVYLPTPLEEGGFDYNVEARPKCSGYVGRTEYKVVKLWKDSSTTILRPKSVTVEIRRDGVLMETVVLNSANNWTYTWGVPMDDTAVWTVNEQGVPRAYTVSISQRQATFTITNTLEPREGEPPKTGDTFAFWPWILTMCFSGSGLLLIGASQIRRRKK